jgi:potassium voltage-gated channel Eag-related subfamily H protein 2
MCFCTPMCVHEYMCTYQCFYNYTIGMIVPRVYSVPLHVCLYTCASTCVPLHMCLYMCASTHMPLHVCLFICASSYVPLYVPLHVCLYTCASTCVPLHMCLCMCASTHVPLHVCLYTCACILMPVAAYLLSFAVSSSPHSSLVKGGQTKAQRWTPKRIYELLGSLQWW